MNTACTNSPSFLAVPFCSSWHRSEVAAASSPALASSKKRTSCAMSALTYSRRVLFAPRTAAQDVNPKPRNSDAPRTHATPIMKNTAFRVVSSTFASEAVESSSSPNAMLMHGKAAPPTAQQLSPKASISRSVGP